MPKDVVARRCFGAGNDSLVQTEVSVPNVFNDLSLARVSTVKVGRVHVEFVLVVEERSEEDVRCRELDVR